MGILSSMLTGTSGLSAQGEALSVFSDNIANAGTIGFKVSRPEFQDVISQSLKGYQGGNQVGRGVRLGAVNPIFSQGSILQTESPTDISITGDGFFVLQGIDGQTYTRNGSMHFDKEGKLINSDNFHVLGYQADDDGKITSKLGEMEITRSVIPAKPTNEVKLFANLDLRSEIKENFDPEQPDLTSHFGTGVTVYDSAGIAHSVNLYFNRTEDGVWTWRAMAKGDEIVGGAKGKMVECAKGKLVFDTDGRLKEQVTDKSSFSFTKGALPNQVVKFNFGADKKSGGNGLEVTQYGTASETYKNVQNGSTGGSLMGLSFNDDGTMIANFTNGQSLVMGKIALAKFENPEALNKVGQNRFRASRLSGEGSIGSPQAGGRGRLTAKTIEASTTDIANEFINLIQAQRNFQANTKVISTSDEMLQDVLNLKRG
ncbi:MAG: flagellar hook protein FlgE [Bdellovibrionia bacterium]